MKPIEQKINTIPDGTWEAGQTNESLQDSPKLSITSDLQKNGYPNNSAPPLPKSISKRTSHKGQDGHKSFSN